LGIIKGTKDEDGYLENYPVFDWQPVKSFGKWPNMFTSDFISKQKEKEEEKKKRKKKKKKGVGGGEEAKYRKYRY